jgi:hypothetical protein
VLLLDNAPSCARDSVLTSDNGLIFVKFLPLSTLQWHKVHTKFHPNPSTGSTVNSISTVIMLNLQLLHLFYFEICTCL